MSAEKEIDYINNPSFDNKLKLSGVLCVICHLRDGKIYWPTARVGGSGHGRLPSLAMDISLFIFFEMSFAVNISEIIATLFIFCLKT